MVATLLDIQRKYGKTVFPLYKDQMQEPYMENKNKIGYEGVVLYNETEDKIQCSVCSEWVESIGGNHLKIKHSITALEYKKEFGIYKKTPLVTPSLSRKLSISSQNQGSWNRPHRSNGFKKGVKISHPMQRSKVTQWNNEHGLCEAQIAARFMIVSNIVKKSPTAEDCQKYDNPLFQAIHHRYSSWNEFKKVMGEKIYTIGRNKKYEDIELLALLRTYTIENHKVPSYRKFDKWCGNSGSRKAAQRYFGSWKRAIMMAGLELL